MRVLTLASAFGVLLSAAAAGAAEPVIEGGGANKFSGAGRSALAADDVTATEIDAELSRAATDAGASGIKSLGGGGELTRVSASAAHARLSSEPARLTGSLAPKGISGATARRALAGDTPLSVVKAPLKAAGKSSIGVKRLATAGGPKLLGVGAKLEGGGVKQLTR